jgi:hypothetical protein
MTGLSSSWPNDASKFQWRNLDVQGVQNAVCHRQVVGVRQGEKPSKLLQRQPTIEEEIQDLRADRVEMRGQAGKQAGRHARNNIVSRVLLGEPAQALTVRLKLFSAKN